MADTEAYLKQESPQLYGRYLEIQQACEKVWAKPKMLWFTDHTTAHSRRMVSLLNKILATLEGTCHVLIPDECFVLLASCYLHDVGMQDVRVDDKPIETLTEEDYERVRKEHAQRTYDLIREGALRPGGADSVDLRIEGLGEYTRAIMRVCKAHATDYFREVLEQIKDDPFTIQNRDIRGALLCALLLIADELDLARSRVDFDTAKLLDLSADSQLHWFTHHYISKVDVAEQKITITFRFPRSFENDIALIQQRAAIKLTSQLGMCNPVTEHSTGGILRLALAEPVNRIDNEGLMREMPTEVLELLRASSATREPEGMQNEDHRQGLRDYTAPLPTTLFTGRDDELKDLASLIAEFPVSMITGIGGTGKTELIAKYLTDPARVGPSKVLWFDLLQQHTIDDIAIAMGRSEMLTAENMTPREKGVNVAWAIEDSGLFTIIDNIQEIDDPALEEMLRYAVRHIRQSRILLIGKARPQVVIELEPQLRVQLINGLKNAGAGYARKLAELWDIEISDDALNQICKDVDNHPLALEAAFRILSYGETAQNLLKKIVSFSNTGSPEGLSKRLIGELESHATPEQSQLAYRLSVFRRPFPRSVAESVAGRADWAANFNVLIDRLILRRQSNLFAMHPVVAALCGERLVDSAQAHTGAADYYKSLRVKKPDAALEAEIVHHLIGAIHPSEAVELVEKHAEDFLTWGQLRALLEMLAEIEGSCGLSDRLRNLRGRVYTECDDDKTAMADLAIAEQSKDVEVRAEAKYRIALIRIGHRRFSEARAILEQALDLAKGECIDKLIAYCTNGLGRVEKGEASRSAGQSRERHLSAALSLLNTAHNLLVLMPDVRPRDIAISQHGIGQLLYEQGKLTPALAKHEDALRIGEDTGDPIGKASSLNEIGVILLAQGKPHEALKKYLQSLQLLESIGMRHGSSSAARHNNIGMALVELGKPEQALHHYLMTRAFFRDVADWHEYATSCHNISIALQAVGKSAEAVLAALEADAYRRSLGLQNDIESTARVLADLRSELGVNRFRQLAADAFEQLPDDLKPHSGYSLYVEDTTVRRDGDKVGRNDPCPCGSGKKYKRCCIDKET